MLPIIAAYIYAVIWFAAWLSFIRFLAGTPRTWRLPIRRHMMKAKRR